LTSVKHFDAKTISDAVSLLREHIGEARIIAGGVDLVSLMKSQVITPKVLVNIKPIPDLAYIREDAGGLKIGVLTPINNIKTAAIIKDKYPMLAEAAQSIVSLQIRNMATIGGNLCQEVRCWYYRMPPVTGRTFFCRRKGGKRCFALAGENQYHSIFGSNQCCAVCPSDMAPALVALDARVKVASSLGEKTVPLEEFYTPLETVLKPDEILTEIQVPNPGYATKQRYTKFSPRKAIDFAISSVAAAITIDGGVVTSARIVLGGVAPTPYRSLRAEDTLKGEVITKTIADASAKISVSEAVPLNKNRYKVSITEALVKRAIVE
jgi:xanthine dehydrogenase YagS FAD-binding subunit